MVWGFASVFLAVRQSFLSGMGHTLPDVQSMLEDLTALRQRVQDLEQALRSATNAAENAANRHQSAENGSGQKDGTCQSRAHVPAIDANGDSPKHTVLADVPMTATRVVMHQLVPASECDAVGICTGGQVLSWIDICAGLAAKTLARGPCVTAGVDAVHFLRPCRLGHVVIIAAMVNRTFNSSMEVGVRVESEDMRTGVRHHCCSAYLTFVSLSARKGPPLPRVVPTDALHRRIFAASDTRRQQRLLRRLRVKDNPELAAAEACRLRPVTHRDGCPTLPPPLWPRAGAGDIEVPPALTRAYMTQSIMPHHANTIGITFGGQVMRWMEECAYISASRMRCCEHMLTAVLDSLAFGEPTHVGDILYVTAQVTAVFTSSVEVMVSVFGESPGEGRVFHCADAYVTVVLLDGEGQPRAVNVTLRPQSDVDARRMQGAERRREERLALRDILLMQEASRPSLDGTLPCVTPEAGAAVAAASAAAAAAGSAAQAVSQQHPPPAALQQQQQQQVHLQAMARRSSGSIGGADTDLGQLL